MTEINTRLDWRATLGGADVLPAEVAVNIDSHVQQIGQDLERYKCTTAALHTCPLAHPLVIMDHARRTPRPAATAMAYRKDERTVAQVRALGKNVSEKQTFFGKGRDVEGKKRQLADKACYGCSVMEAGELMEQALFGLIASAGKGDFQKPGWDSPVSAFACKCGSVQDCESDGQELCRHTYLKVKQTMQEMQAHWGGTLEVRLNGAGLKLYLKAPRRSLTGEGLEFGMSVGGDQLSHYHGFQPHAHRLFAALGVPTLAFRKTK